MNTLTDSIQQLTDLDPDLQIRVFETFLILLLLGIARRIAVKVVWRQTQDIRARYRWRKTSSYVIGLISFLLIGRIWFEWAAGSLATYLGLLSAGLAVALRDMISDLAGWIFIVWRRPFEVGDRVQMGEFAGDVVDQRVFQFTLLEIGNWVDADQSTGRVVHIPNGRIFNEPLANFTQGLDYIWNEIPVLVTLESNWRKAKKLLLRIALDHGRPLSEEEEARVLTATRKYMIFYSTLQPTVYTAVRDSGILLTIRHLCEPRRRRGTGERIWEAILDAFAKHDDIDFAYPTQRYYSNVQEGKPGVRVQPR